MSDFDYDVAIVGFGPVGQVLAGLLGQAGHRVGVFERYADVYPLPRAIRLDGEAMRIFHRLGIAEEVQRDALPVDRYKWFGADGDLILDIDLSRPHPSGFSSDWVFYQPHTEAALVAAVAAQPSVKVNRGWTATGLTQTPDAVELTVQAQADGSAAGRRTVRARYVVGADGANSFVREACGIGWVDLGFAERWLVCDVRPHDVSRFDHLPLAAQHCDPARPAVATRNGTHHRRWEFMMIDGDDPDAYARDPALTWGLLQGRISPDEGVLVRHAVYQFRSMIAETMRDRRALLVGDAAHLMPPFMGEGMCSGLRDANNLAWRLDLVLGGVAGDPLLDSYSLERRHQNEAVVQVSLMMGKVSCTLDPDAARERDAAFRSGAVPPPPPVPGIGDGVVHHPADGADPVAGRLAVQGTVRRNGQSGRFDDVIGPGFAVICRQGDALTLLSSDQLEFLERIGAHVVSLDQSVTGVTGADGSVAEADGSVAEAVESVAEAVESVAEAVADIDGALTAWMSDNDLSAVIVRPDGYAFGGVRASEKLPDLVAELRLLVHETDETPNQFDAKATT